MEERGERMEEGLDSRFRVDGQGERFDALGREAGEGGGGAGGGEDAEVLAMEGEGEGVADAAGGAAGLGMLVRVAFC